MRDPYYSSDRLSNSKLTLLKQSPREFAAIYVHKTMVQKEKKSWKFGRLLHCIALEPHKFDEDYIRFEKFDRRTKEGKANAALFEEKAIGRTIVDDKDYEQALTCTRALCSHDEVGDLLLHKETHDAKVEVPIRFELFGVEMQCKVDWLSIRHKLVLDIKTTKSVVPEEFAKSIFGFGYHRQAAIYSFAIEKEFGFRPKFIFAGVTKTELPEVSACDLDAEDVALGMSEVEALIEDYKKRKQTGNWLASYETGVVRIKRPRWYTGQVLTLDDEESEGGEDE